MPWRFALAIGIDAGPFGMLSAMRADDGMIDQQFVDPFPVIQQLVVHRVPPVPRTERITQTEHVFGDAFGNEEAVRRVAGNTPFLADLLAAYYCVMDQQTPTRVRAILLAALAYFILPLDTIPDFLAFFGFTDDIAVLTAAIAAVSGSITETHKQTAQKALRDFAETAE